VDVTVNGKRVKAIAQLSKQAYVYVLDRVTGKPVWPIEERPVPQSDVPGERTSPTQPIPTKPAAYDRQGYDENELINFTPELRAEALALVKSYRLGPLYTPPSLVIPGGTKGSWYNPGGTGGSVWEPGGVDPETGILYVPSQAGATIIAVEKNPKSDVNFSRVLSGGRLAVRDLPILKPPYSRITAIDLNSGEHLWAVPAGDTPEYIKNNPSLAGLTIPKTGTPATRPTILVTKTLLFAGEGWGGGRMLHAYDKKTGAIVWETSIPGMMGCNPMSYMLNGKQYIAFTVGDATHEAELLVYALADKPTTKP
jgi:quinoprotein glucose dehydrogenase